MTSHQFWFFVALVTNAASAVVLARHYGRVDIFAPGLLALALLGLGYLVPYWSFVNEVDDFSDFWPVDWYAFEDSVEDALRVYAVGVVSLTLGFLLAGPLRKSSSGFHGVEAARKHARLSDRLEIAYWVCASVGAVLLFFIGLARLGGWSVLRAGLGDRIRLFEGLNYFFLPTTVFVSLALALTLSWAATTRFTGARFVGRTHLIAGAVALAIAVMFAALLGNKSTIFVAVAAMVVLLHFVYRAIPLWVVMLAAAIGYPLLMAYQLIVREYLVVGYLPSISVDNPVRDFLRYMASEFDKNFMQLQTLTVLVDRMPADLDFQYGMTLAAFFTLPIPSWLMPDKLLPSPGVFTLAFWPERWLEQGTTLPPGILGEFYMNFGIAGVVVGSVMCGVALERLYWRVRANPFQMVSAVSYAVLAASLLHFIRGETTAPLMLALSIIIPVAIGGMVGRRSLP